VACILVSTRGWQIHDGRIERVHQAESTVAAPVMTPDHPAAPDVEATFVHHLSPSVPWPAWAGLIVLCILPAVGSVLSWSGSRRGREVTSSTSGGSP
jgi:hypothetical protein